MKVKGRTSVSIVGVAIWLCFRIQSASSHGYLSTPRSRNLLASEETVWWPKTAGDPQPETCKSTLKNHNDSAETTSSLG